MLHQLPKELLVEQVNNGLILLLLGMGVAGIHDKVPLVLRTEVSS